MLTTPRHAARLALVALSLWSVSATAQERAFSARFTATDTGDVRLLGNVLMTCDPAQTTDCVDARNGAAVTSRNNNNAHVMMMVDVDSDAATFNSSTAQLALSSDAQVLFAGLYWGANVDGGTDGVDAPSAVDKGKVKLKVPGRTTYDDVVSSVCDTRTNDYQCFADVTTLLPMVPSGGYTVANVQTGTGKNRYAGWALVVVYRDPAEPTRNLVVYDGYQYIASSNNNVGIPVSGFLTPPSGPVSTSIGLVGYEGDFNATGDSLRLDGTAVRDTLNPTSNVFNSSNTQFDQHNTTQQPAQINQLGFDVDLIRADGVIANNAMSALLEVRTGGETYFPGVITFATEIYAPRPELIKSVVDLDGGDFEPGDEVEFTLALTNAGFDAAQEVVLTDTLVQGLDYVANSATIDGASAGSKASWSAATRTLTVHVGAGATDSVGGSVASMGSATVTFRARIDAGLTAGTQLPNQAWMDYKAATLATAFRSVSDSDPAQPGKSPVVITVDTNPPLIDITSPANMSAQNTTPTISGTTEPGATVSVRIDGSAPVMVTADASGNWSVMWSGMLGEGQHVITAESTDRAGNTGAATSAFQIDTTAPMISFTAPAATSIVATPRPPIEGLTEPNRPVQLTIDQGGAISLMSDGSGRFVFVPVQDLTNGTHQARATTTDTAGNNAETTVTFTVDTSAPQLTIDAPASGSFISETRPTITGTAENNASVTLRIDNGAEVTVTADDQGKWSHVLTSPLDEGGHTAQASSTNPLGVTATTQSTFTVDLTAPTVTILQPTAGETVRNTRPPLRGTTEPLASLVATSNGAMIGAIDALANGDWVIQPSVDLPRGPITATVTATDRAGNTGSAEVSFVVDAGEVSILNITYPQDGALLTANDDLTRITGTSNPDAPITLVINGAAPVVVTADGQGAWSYMRPMPFNDGTHTVEASTPGQQVRVSFTVDATPPALTIDSPAQGDAFNDGKQTVRGTGEPGREVQVFVDGDRVGVTTVGNDGTWTFDLTAELEPGGHDITARSSDEAGNVAETTVTISIADLGNGTNTAEDSCACGTAPQSPTPLTPLLVLGLGLVGLRRRR